jgi:uncharacterized protein (TIGR03437 family)
MNFARYEHTAVLLTDGRLLVLGGWKFQGPGVPPAVAGPPEIFDPATETWSVTTFTGDPKGYLHSLFPAKPMATLLPDGRVLLVGTVGDTSLIFNLAKNAIEYALRPASNPSGHPMVLLPNGKVLSMTNGRDRERGLEIGGVDIFDPVTNSWSKTSLPSINGVALAGGFLAGLLPNGKVLGTLITAQGETYGQMSALYDPKTGTWSDYASRNSYGYRRPYAVALASGEVITLMENDLPEIYDPAKGLWRSLFPAISLNLSPLLLADGQVFTGRELFGFDFGSNPPVNVVSASAASFRVDALARGSIATAFGASLSDSTSINSVTISIKDQSGAEYSARVLSVSPNQVNYQAPDQLIEGQAEMTIRNTNGQTSRGLISVVRVSPGLFTANADGRGVPAAVALRIRADNSVSYEPVARFDSAQNRFVVEPIDLGAPDDRVFLVLFGTGLQRRTSLENVQVYIGGVKVETLYAGEQPSFPGLDQINARIPRSLVGRGEVDVLVTVDGKIANQVELQIK